MTVTVANQDGAPLKFQFRRVNEGQFIPSPIEDPERVDMRRAAVGMMPLAQYLEFAKLCYQKMSQPQPKVNPVTSDQ